MPSLLSSLLYPTIDTIPCSVRYSIYDPTEFHASLQYSTLHAIIIIINNFRDRQVNVTVAMAIRFRTAI